MDRSRNRFSRGAPVGGSSLLVIFAVLCLTVFALLALSTVQAGERLSVRSAQAVSDYYDADLRAEQILARIRAGECPEGVTAQDGRYDYSVPMTEAQMLEVSVQLEEDGYTVLRWQTVYTADWQPDTSLDLWDGQNKGE